MQSVADTCLGLEIAPHQIWLSLERRMHCGVGLCGHCYLADNLVCTQGPSYRYDKYIALKQKTTSFTKQNEIVTYC
jgi:anaerobic sulfite reductase subunit B